MATAGVKGLMIIISQTVTWTSDRSTAQRDRSTAQILRPRATNYYTNTNKFHEQPRQTDVQSTNVSSHHCRYL